MRGSNALCRAIILLGIALLSVVTAQSSYATHLTIEDANSPSAYTDFHTVFVGEDVQFKVGTILVPLVSFSSAASCLWV